MFDWFQWFTRLDNSKMLSLVLFLSAFCGILVYVFGNRRRGQRLESYKNIPFLDDTPPPPGAGAKPSKVKDNEQHDD